MSDSQTNPTPFRLQPGSALAFDDAGQPVGVEWPIAAPTAREMFEENLLEIGLEFSTVISAGDVFDEELEKHATALAGEKLQRVLEMMKATKLAKSVEYLAILKLLSPEKSLEEICAGTGHSKQKLHYNVCRLGRIFDSSRIGDGTNT